MELLIATKIQLTMGAIHYRELSFTYNLKLYELNVDFEKKIGHRQTDRQTDTKTDCLTPCCACARGVIILLHVSFMSQFLAAISMA